MSVETTHPDESSQTPTHSDLTALDVMEAFEAANPYVEPHFWEFGTDFGSDLEAALHWARCGFEVRPAGWVKGQYVTRPEDVAVAWSGKHFRDPVMARAPRGVLAIVTEREDADLYGQAPPMDWNRLAPHQWVRDWTGPASLQTFTVRMPWNNLAVRLWTVPEGFEYPAGWSAHHFPDSVGMLTTRFGRDPFPLPCRSSSVIATGMIQPAPAHVLRLADMAPLPCREQDDKGYPCSDCARYNNHRTAEYLAPIWDKHVMGADR